MSNPNVRRGDETHKQYRERLRKEQSATPGWSRMLCPAYNGTYIKAAHGELDGNWPSRDVAHNQRQRYFASRP